MDWQRTVLLGSMAVVGVLLFIKWNEFQESKVPPAAVSTTLPSTTVPAETAALLQTSNDQDSGEIPSAPEEKQQSNIAVSATSQLISVKTDTLVVLIDTLGGDIVKVALPKYLAALDTPDVPFEMLNRTEDHLYIAQSGLFGSNGTDEKGKRPLFTAQKSEYVLSENDQTLNVDLTLKQGGVNITKRFIFHHDDYLIGVEYLIDNQTDKNWKANFFAQIQRDDMKPPTDVGIGVQPFLGAAITTNEEHYKKFTFDDLNDESFKTSKKGGWVAMVQHYFLSAWIPDPETENSFTLTRLGDKNIYLLRFTTPSTVVPPHSEGVIKAAFYSGPKKVYRLEEISPYLDLTVDYGWLWWIAKYIFQFLHWIHSYVGNWGASIILLTITVKLIFFPLTAASYRSMANMRRVQPLMQDLKERYGDNRQKMSEELMKLYRKEKVNPLGGCLPMLIPMPVFIALYWVLMESVELRHTPFLGWIDDLSVKDPYFILPLLMGITMWLTQKLQPTPTDPTQARVMQLMPIIFTVMFLWFPAGLVLYWVVNNSISFIQQYIITRKIESMNSSK